MKYYIIIPAHNEEAFINRTLNSVIDQSLPPKRVVVVNDNSTDNTETIIDSFVARKSFINKINISSSTIHLPGSKVILAFNAGLEVLDDDYDFIVKLDADIVLPKNYFEKVGSIYKSYSKAGIVGGFAYEKNAEGAWQLNHPMNKDHVRGAFKAYAKSCFSAIGGLKPAMGWDTADELLAQYHGFEIHTEETLKVKHLRPLGTSYNPKARLLQGEAMYRLRYKLILTIIASLKMSWKFKKSQLFTDNLKGYFNARRTKLEFLVSKEEGIFIRKLRWRNIGRILF